jgi:uncharacterized protein (TIGR02145 family)
MKKISIIILGFLCIFDMFAQPQKKTPQNPSQHPGFAVSQAKTVKDIDGNIYHTVVIGNQTWMVENLKTTHYNDSTAIPLVTEDKEWADLITPAYCWYNNDATYIEKYGALYNWFAVETGKLAPVGWHVPSDAEWTTLTTYLGGEEEAGGKLKEAGTVNWKTPNTGATNSTGFSALPGGWRSWEEVGKFSSLGGTIGLWWSSTEATLLNAWLKGLLYNDSNLSRAGEFFKMDGISVRCVMD